MKQRINTTLHYVANEVQPRTCITPPPPSCCVTVRVRAPAQLLHLLLPWRLQDLPLCLSQGSWGTNPSPQLARAKPAGPPPHPNTGLIQCRSSQSWELPADSAAVPITLPNTKMTTTTCTAPMPTATQGQVATGSTAAARQADASKGARTAPWLGMPAGRALPLGMHSFTATT